jgi:DNA-binding transcriptional regulator YbjK
MRLILDAAVGVIGTHGLRGLTHRAVDERAGLPQGSCSAYLRTRQALLGAVAEHVGRRLTDDVGTLADRLAEHPADEPFKARQTSDLFLAWLHENDLLVARLELTLESARRPELRESFIPWRDRLEEVVGQVIARAGHDRTPAHAQTVTASLEGILLRALVLPEDARAGYVERTVDLLFRALSTVAD